MVSFSFSFVSKKVLATAHALHHKFSPNRLQCIGFVGDRCLVTKGQIRGSPPVSRKYQRWIDGWPLSSPQASSIHRLTKRQSILCCTKNTQLLVRMQQLNHFSEMESQTGGSIDRSIDRSMDVRTQDTSRALFGYRSLVISFYSFSPTTAPKKGNSAVVPP